MPSRTARRTIWIIAGVAILLFAMVSAIPFVASTQIVRNRISHELSEWSGYRVVLRGAPRIQVWPAFEAHLQDVAFLEWGATDAPPILQADRIEIDLSAIAALRGDIAFSDISVLRPVLRVRSSPDGMMLPAAPGGSRMVRAIDTARALVDANPAQPDVSLMPSDTFGTIEFADGRVLLVEAGEEREIISSITGRAAWPALNRSGTLVANAVWRGEPLTVDISAQQPLALFGGGNSRITASLTSAPLTGSFEGLTTLSKSGFVDGTVKLTSPSLRRALEWSKTDIQPGAAVGSASISGRLIGDSLRMKIEDAQLAFGGHPGNGLLEFSLANGIPAVSGTLAFQSFDAYSFISAFTRLPGDGARWSDEMDVAFTRQVNLDLRLSAASAVVGPLTMTDVAATAQVKDGLAAFDISDATVFGGTLQTGFRVDTRSDHNGTELRMLASDIDMQGAAGAMGSKLPMPKGKGTLSIALKGPKSRWDQLAQTLSGTISLKFGPGSLQGLDLAAFVARAEKGGFFALNEVPTGVIPFESAEFRAAVSEGMARLELAKATLPEKTVSFTGIIPYVGHGLALSGLISSRESAAPKQAPASFFVGGSWDAPFVSPIMRTMPIE
ncbi:AsmA-like C-terminal region-containing protein [Aquibium sp. LZ166]|uniref:AsmA-like C-terminal region-containing protein n=1 Tax=Aquibium pacificus TaxID=3153579 RepID=A0ABV3SCR2_9HYPH